MELTVFERLIIRNIVPNIQGWNYGHMKEARELLENLFTPEEEAELQFEQDGGQVKWKTQRDDGTDIVQEKEIAISEGLKNKIGKFLKQLDREEKLEFMHMSLFDKFTGG